MTSPYETNNREIAENKLILLYLLNKLELGVTDLHIVKLVRENNLMNYFILQSQLSELKKASLVIQKLSDDDRLLYYITNKGKEMLSMLGDMIPPGIRMVIDDIFMKAKKEIRQQSQITADFTPESDSFFYVTCTANEVDFDLIKVDIGVGSRSDAFQITSNWKKHSAQIYSEIMQALLKNRE